MKYGFVIDNRKCIGCHACTTACKSEHQVPVGVNRTWVKQVEKGAFPLTKRLFSVMRCNHCSDAPCVDICPVEALFTRDDGIVDFDNRRCIGCKSCMQACPYDALYIDPDHHTAAKCNYCAHRIDIGLEPACVNVCPEHAIISGDIENTNSEIAQILSRHPTKVRKPEKRTNPNLFYIDADDVSLVAEKTEKTRQYFWSSQSLGVGHYAKATEKWAFTNPDVIDQLEKMQEVKSNGKSRKSIDVLMDLNRRIYDAPDKGILWGWEVPAYVFTKAIAAGMIIVLFVAYLFNISKNFDQAVWISIVTSLIFLLLTGVFLIKDLDRPDRFLYVLLRPQWKSWLVRGGYAITLFGALLSLLVLAKWLEWESLWPPLLWITVIVSLLVAVYTAFLFAQAKGRDFWQSPILSLHMLLHAIMAGAAILLIITIVKKYPSEWGKLLTSILALAIVLNLLVIAMEIFSRHRTIDVKNTVHMIAKGEYKYLFWIGVVFLGNLTPLLLTNANIFLIPSAILTLIGIYLSNHIWITAPQKIPLS